MFYALAILYFEIILVMTTVGLSSAMYGVYIALFSVGIGMALVPLTAVSKKPGINRIIRALFLLINAILYGAIYLTYKEYMMFYDLETMLSGAGGAFAEYGHEVKLLVLSTSGMITIALLILPFILYVIFGIIKKKDKGAFYSRDWQLAAVGIMCVALALAQILISHNEADNLAYSEQYTFNQAVPRFGLLRSLTIELSRGMSHKGGSDTFDFAATEYVYVPVTTPSPAVSVNKALDDSISENAIDAVEGPVEYGFNQLDIDFDSLSEVGGELAVLDQYVASLQPSRKNEYTGLFEGKNLILITAEAFTAEAIDENLTPTLYRMATKGIQFTDYYQPAGAGTTGGEYQNIFGMLATSGGNSVKNTQEHYNYMTMGTQLDRLGYSGAAFHNGMSTFYDRHLTHTNLGYSDGYFAMGSGLEDMVTGVWSSDITLFQDTLPLYFDREPFNLYYMTISGHSPYMGGYAYKYWNEVSSLEHSELVKGYYSTQMELDRAMEWTLNALEEQGIADDTVIVISADHFPYGLDDASLGMGYENLMDLYGTQIKNEFDRDHNRLIIWSGCLEDDEPIVVDTPTESIDILPTLLNLYGIEFDSRLLPGRDVFSDAMPLVYYTNNAWKTDLGTYIYGYFTPAEGVEIPDGYVQNVTAIVKNRLNYSRGVLWNDYFRHVFEGHEWSAAEN